MIVGLNVGGAESMLKRLLLSHSDRNDIHHIVISLTGLGEIGGQLIDKGLTVHCLKISSVFNLPIGFLQLRALLKQIHPSIVQTWMYHADLIGGLAARSVGIEAIIWGVRTTHITQGRVTIYIRKICALLSGWLPQIILCAARSSCRLHQDIGYKKSKMHVIPNGFSIGDEHNVSVNGNTLRAELGINDNSLLIVSVGRFNPDKDHETFIRAAQRVLAKRPEAKFVLVGRDLDRTNKTLTRSIQNSGIGSAVYLLGHRPDVSSILQCCDVFCLHSITEGFPNVLGEAMACQLPCVTTDVGDARYLLGDDKWVVPPKSPSVLADKIVILLSMSRSERGLLGAENADRIKTRFEMSAISDRYFDLYRLTSSCL